MTQNLEPARNILSNCEEERCIQGFQEISLKEFQGEYQGVLKSHKRKS